MNRILLCADMVGENINVQVHISVGGGEMSPGGFLYLTPTEYVTLSTVLQMGALTLPDAVEYRQTESEQVTSAAEAVTGIERPLSDGPLDQTQ